MWLGNQVDEDGLRLNRDEQNKLFISELQWMMQWKNVSQRVSKNIE